MFTCFSSNVSLLSSLLCEFDIRHEAAQNLNLLLILGLLFGYWVASPPIVSACFCAGDLTATPSPFYGQEIAFVGEVQTITPNHYRGISEWLLRRKLYRLGTWVFELTPSYEVSATNWQLEVGHHGERPLITNKPKK